MKMGFALTIVYVVLTIISPGQFGAEFANYHPMVYLAALTAVASLPEFIARLNSRLAVQIHLAVLFIIAIAVSQLHNGLMAAKSSLLDALPSAAVLFFIVVNVNTLRRVKIMIWVIIATCLGITTEALCGYYAGFRDDTFVLLQFGEIRRLRSAGFLNDPNDLAQFILIALPLIFVGWSRGRIVINSLLVIPSAAFLLWAVYLTHSRGALVALGVLLLVAFHKTIGAVPSIALAGVLVFGLLALNFTGGRGISASDGVDRLELWAQGLQYFKGAPFVGIGFGEFADSEFSGITAHNSFVLCLAELGLLGSTVLVGFLVTAFMGLSKIIEGAQQTFPEAVVEDVKIETATEAATFPALARNSETESEVDQEEMVRAYAVVLRLGFISFITTSFFLSRSYTPVMFLMVGSAAAIIALEPNRLGLGDLRRQILVTCVVEIVAIAVVYGVVRLRT
jgi:O-antigen ligase